ncbi:hypothetical protein [Streptomyces sp. NPDC051567]|uniref:hypothetical protein n=1 Tax=Streptomyces sp. NPDC051567 TaxID=3365660 RepID=UPI0037BBE57B
MLAALAVLSAGQLPAAWAAPASAAVPEILNCTVNASVTFSPPLSASALATTVAIGGTVSNCVDSRTGGAAVVGGSLSATLLFSRLSCSPLPPPALAAGSSATFTWNLRDGTQAGSTVTGIAVTEVDGAGTLTGTVTGASSRLAGEKLTAVLNIDSDQPVVDNCLSVILGTGDPIPRSTLTADVAFS